MKFSFVPKWIVKNLKCIVTLLILILIVCVPWLKLWAAADNHGQVLNANNAVSDLLQMLGGGGLGAWGNEVVRNKHKNQTNQWDASEPSGFGLNSTGLNTNTQELERRWLKDSEVIRTHQKKLQSKINTIEFFLGKKFEDFNRKDTYH